MSGGGPPGCVTPPGRPKTKGPPKKAFKIHNVFHIDFWRILASKIAPKIIPKSLQNRLRIQIGILLCFSVFLAPHMESTTPENINITYVKQPFPQIGSFPFNHRFGTKKSLKTSLKPSKTLPKSMSQTHRKSLPKIVDFGLKMTHQMSPGNVQKSTGGSTLGQHGIQKDPKRRSRQPGGPKREVQGLAAAPFS